MEVPPEDLRAQAEVLEEDLLAGGLQEGKHHQNHQLEEGAEEISRSEEPLESQLERQHLLTTW